MAVCRADVEEKPKPSKIKVNNIMQKHKMRSQKFKMYISEPWDFKSSDGDNLIFVSFKKKIKQGIIVCCASLFENSSKELLLTFRSNNCYNSFNIYPISNENTCMNDIIKNNTFWIGNFDDMDFLKIKQIIYIIDEKF